MTALLIIGLIFALSLFFTVAAVSCFFGELAFTGSVTPMSGVLACIAAAFWWLLFWLQPLQISISIAPL